LLFVVAYMLGPLAPVVMRQGAGSVVWALLGLAGAPVWALLVWRWPEVTAWLAQGRIPFLPWFAGMLALTVVGTLAWARAVYLAGRDPRFDAAKLPGWLRGPGLVGYVGLFAPGGGLLLGGAPRRAALAVVNAGIAAVAGLVLWHAPLLWKINLATDAIPLSGRTLETVFLAAGALGFLAALGWIASVLDGMRVGLQRIGGPRTALGDWLNLVLLVALAALYVTSEPSLMARDMDAYATSFEHRGMQLVPLQLVRLSQRLDPARPAYAVHEADLLEASGEPVHAAQVRAGLRGRWNEYVRIFAPSMLAVVDSAAAAADSLHHTGVDSLGSAPLVPPPHAPGDSLASGSKTH
jgi:hypothetical protein